MSDHTIELDDLMDHLNVVVDEPSEWPGMSIEYSVRWHAAEPDVGIFSKQPEITKVSYCLDGEWFTDVDAFADAIYDRIGMEIDNGPDELSSMISARIDNDLADLEDGE